MLHRNANKKHKHKSVDRRLHALTYKCYKNCRKDGNDLRHQKLDKIFCICYRTTRCSGKIFSDKADALNQEVTLVKCFFLTVDLRRSIFFF